MTAVVSVVGIPPTRRVEVLLATSAVAREAWHRGSGGGGVTLMPSLWHEGSYAELERVLGEVRDGDRRQLWWHLTHRYLFGSEVVMFVRTDRRKGNVRYHLPPCTQLLAGGARVGENMSKVRVYRWDHRVRPELVEEGLELVAGLMYDGDTGRIVVPREFRDLLSSRP